MKIAILDDYQDAVRHLNCRSLLEGYLVKVFTNSVRGLGQLSIRLAPFQVVVLIGQRTYLSRQLLNKLPNLQLVVQTGTSLPHLDMAAAKERGIVVMGGEDDPVAVAELTWTLILAASRKLVHYANHLQQGAWQASSLAPARNTLGSRLSGKTLGLCGYNRVGQLVAGFGQAFGMTVQVWSPAMRLATTGVPSAMLASSKAALFECADVVSLHMALDDATRGCVTADDLSSMKPTALFVNTSASALVTPGSLETTLAQGRPAAAAIDVFDTEPAAPDLPWLGLENLLATPHLGTVTVESYEQAFASAFAAINNFSKNQFA